MLPDNDPWVTSGMLGTEYRIRMDYTSLPSSIHRIDRHNRGVPTNAKDYLFSGFLVSFIDFRFTKAQGLARHSLDWGLLEGT